MAAISLSRCPLVAGGALAAGPSRCPRPARAQGIRPRGQGTRLGACSSVDSQQPAVNGDFSRRGLLAAVAGASVAVSGWASPASVQAREMKFVQAGGIEYCDVAVGRGDTTFDGDTIKVTFTAHTYDTETGKKIKTFDPFVNGGGGSSMANGFKLTLGNVNGDIIPGLNLGIVGGDGVEPMKMGGKRVLRIPPELAFGSKGHSCYLGLKDQCQVPPDTPVEIEVAFVDFV
eukprot:jgi/Tetstr1/435951/TSEL_024832.t1